MSAIISQCGTYRYRLDRDIQIAGSAIAFFGINPSTASAVEEDATTRKWIGFAKMFGARRYIAGNPFALRSPNVKDLATKQDPVGPANDMHLKAIIADADVLIPCWGNITKVPKSLRYRFEDLKQMLVASGKPIKVFGLTGSGSPMHPLMLPYNTELRAW